jgi:phosphatidylserine/phosphatidylglycerophosphate/cardiolipin synthase-like enzyme
MLPKNRPLSYAPRGRFEIKTVWEKAIAGAEDYIYIEDQAFTSTEVFDWINARLKARPALKVMLVTGGADPTAPAPGAQIVAMSQAINNHLLKGLSTADITGRVGLYGYRRRFVHTKSTVIDDAWAMIGSGNAMRRSLYTDFEHNVAFMDEAAAAVPAFRRPLWKAHLGTEHATAAAGIAAWFAVPFRAGPPTGAADPVQRLTLPLPPTTMSSRDQVIVDELIDPDSRRPWGSSLASLALSAAGAAILSN